MLGARALLLPRSRCCVRVLGGSVRDGAYDSHDDALKRAGSNATLSQSREEHNTRQAAVFDEATARGFAEPVPPEIRAKLDRIAREATKGLLLEFEEERPLRILDVGAGAGALRGSFPTDAMTVGVDVSEAMLRFAEGYDELWVGDVVDYPSRWVDESGEPFDVAVFNACFGNLYDQRASLDAAAQVVRPGGRVVIAHPLGATFVDDLHRRDPSVVPGTLPRTPQDMQRLCGRPRSDSDSGKFNNKGESYSFLAPKKLLDDDDDDVYVATFDRKAVAPLERCLVARGPVKRGYGRGSKKLGFPTANLPEDLFGPILAEVPAGVYSCFAIVDDEPEVVRRAVANVGYSPTFQGKENPMKIIEAYLIDGDNRPDFYGATLTLLLVAFQRPERKFPNFDALLRNIRNDASVAADALHSPDIAHLQHHPAFRGTGGTRDDVVAAWVDPA